MPKAWKLKEKIPADVAQNYEGFPPLLAQLLYNRKLKGREEIEEFLAPEYERLHSPFLFLDMQKAVDRIWQAIGNNQKIVVYGDYDADAVTANAVLRQTFKYLNHDNVASYIPDRFSEGYGVNLEAVKKIKAEGAAVIITVDCGTNSTEVAEWCQANEVDFIITDHHEIIGPHPKAYALINPKNPEDAYPYHEITGVGVAFKLAAGMLSRKEKVISRLEPSPPTPLPKGEGGSAKYVYGYEKWLLDLVAIGTVADCHSLIGENRILVKFGLKVLQKTRWPGLKALIKSARLDILKQIFDTYTLGFVIAPRLNAAGRLEHANIALDLLLEENPMNAETKAAELENINLRRQETTQRILSDAKEQALLLSDRKVLVIMSADWHKGVVGLVAGRLAEEFYKPAIVLQIDGGEATGSARTAGDFNIVEALKHASEHLTRFGGHTQAAGLSLLPENYEIFYQSILEYADKHLPESREPVLELETEIFEKDLTLNTFEEISVLEPFGIGNPRPKFLLKNAQVLSQRQVGTEGKHLQMQLQIGESIIPAIAFSFHPLPEGSTIDLACEVLLDGWNGRRQLKLKVVDLRKI